MNKILILLIILVLLIIFNLFNKIEKFNCNPNKNYNIIAHTLLFPKNMDSTISQYSNYVDYNFIYNNIIKILNSIWNGNKKWNLVKLVEENIEKNIENYLDIATNNANSVTNSVTNSDITIDNIIKTFIGELNSNPLSIYKLLHPNIYDDSCNIHFIFVPYLNNDTLQFVKLNNNVILLIIPLYNKESNEKMIKYISLANFNKNWVSEYVNLKHQKISLTENNINSILDIEKNVLEFYRGQVVSDINAIKNTNKSVIENYNKSKKEYTNYIEKINNIKIDELPHIFQIKQNIRRQINDDKNNDSLKSSYFYDDLLKKEINDIKTCHNNELINKRDNFNTDTEAYNNYLKKIKPYNTLLDAILYNKDCDNTVLFIINNYGTYTNNENNENKEYELIKTGNKLQIKSCDNIYIKYINGLSYIYHSDDTFRRKNEYDKKEYDLTIKLNKFNKIIKNISTPLHITKIFLDKSTISITSDNDDDNKDKLKQYYETINNNKTQINNKFIIAESITIPTYNIDDSNNNIKTIINNTTHQSLSELEQKQLTKYVEQLDQTTMSTANDTFKKIDETVKLPFEYNGNLMYNKNTDINQYIKDLQHITYSVFDRESKRLLTPQFIPGQSTVADLTIPSFNMNYNDFDSNKINTNTYSYY